MKYVGTVQELWKNHHPEKPNDGNGKDDVEVVGVHDANVGKTRPVKPAKRRLSEPQAICNINVKAAPPKAPRALVAQRCSDMQ